MLQSIHLTSAPSSAMPRLVTKIKDIGGPVLHGDVLDFGVFERNQFDDSAVQRGRFVFRRGAAFHVSDFSAFVGNDQVCVRTGQSFLR